jgi:hypothetical protein
MVQNTVGLKVVPPLVVAILLVAACGSSSSAARHSPAASSSLTAAASAAPSASPAGSPAPVAGYGVLVTNGPGDTYALSLVDTSGKVVASAQPSSPTAVTCGDSAAAVLPLPVSTSNTRVYFLDQQGNVNYLTPNGETGRATHVPTGGSIRSMFAISPDDTRIAVVENTYNSSGATTVLYAEDVNGGTNHVKLFSETGAYTLWPIGWHGTTDLVVAKVPSCTLGGGPTCCGPQEYHVVDPSTGARRYTVGGSQCIPVGAPTSAGALCENSTFTQLHVLGWTGAVARSYPIVAPTPAYLSPDGKYVAFVVDNSTSIAGSSQSFDLLACGWIDSTHVLAGGDANSQPRIGDLTTGGVVPVAAQGVCGGAIPGGL